MKEVFFPPSTLTFAELSLKLFGDPLGSQPTPRTLKPLSALHFTCASQVSDRGVAAEELILICWQNYNGPLLTHVIFTLQRAACQLVMTLLWSLPSKQLSKTQPG